MEISVFDADELIFKLELEDSFSSYKNITPENKEELSKLANECCESTYKTQIKDAWQRAVCGFCYRDAFYIGDWFLTIIPEMLKIFRKTHFTTPDFPGTSRETWGDQWNKILDKMIFLFRECREETCSMKNPYKKEYFKAFNKKGIPEDDISDKYHEEETKISEYREKCRLEAMELFTKWMKDLFD